MEYPYPIQDWTDPKAYPTADALSPSEWAWEFLRRNPEYQALFDQFKTLPDNYTLEDGSTSNKNGKWKGTPWYGFRFFEDGACWYADPPPIPGESLDEYDERTGGEIMPFAEYFGVRFKVSCCPPLDPREPFPEDGFFTEGMCKEQRVPSWPLDGIFPPDFPPSEHDGAWPRYREYMEIIRDPYKYGYLFRTSMAIYSTFAIQLTSN